MRIRPALKGRNKTLVPTLVVPFQGVAFFITRSRPQGDALGWNVAAPSGRNAVSATSRGASEGRSLKRPSLALQACKYMPGQE